MARGNSFWRGFLGFRRSIPRQRYILLSVLSFLGALLVWSGLTYGGIVPPLFLPSPGDVVIQTIVLFREHGLINDIAASVFRVTVGFLLATAVAVPLGVLMGTFGALDALFAPFTAFVRYMPVAGFIPLLILWFGIGHLEKIVLLFIGVFFFLLAMIVSVVSGVRQELVDTALTLGATHRQTLFRVILPAAAPGIFDSMRTMMGAGWTYVVVAELVAAESGLGKMIMESQRFLLTSRVIAGIIIIGLIGVLFDTLFRILRPVLFPWAEE